MRVTDTGIIGPMCKRIITYVKRTFTYDKERNRILRRGIAIPSGAVLLPTAVINGRCSIHTDNIVSILHDYKCSDTQISNELPPGIQSTIETTVQQIYDCEECGEPLTLRDRKMQACMHESCWRRWVELRRAEQYMPH